MINQGFGSLLGGVSFGTVSYSSYKTTGNIIGFQDSFTTFVGYKCMNTNHMHMYNLAEIFFKGKTGAVPIEHGRLLMDKCAMQHYDFNKSFRMLPEDYALRYEVMRTIHQYSKELSVINKVIIKLEEDAISTMVVGGDHFTYNEIAHNLVRTNQLLEEYYIERQIRLDYIYSYQGDIYLSEMNTKKIKVYYDLGGKIYNIMDPTQFNDFAKARYFLYGEHYRNVFYFEKPFLGTPLID